MRGFGASWGGLGPAPPPPGGAVRRFQSDRVSSSSSSSASSGSCGRSSSCCSVTVRDLWKRGLMSCSLSGMASSSSTSPCVRTRGGASRYRGGVSRYQGGCQGTGRGASGHPAAPPDQPVRIPPTSPASVGNCHHLRGVPSLLPVLPVHSIPAQKGVGSRGEAAPLCVCPPRVLYLEQDDVDLRVFHAVHQDGDQPKE